MDRDVAVQSEGCGRDSRKTCWTLAEHAGDATAYGPRHLLSRAKWDADALRDDLRSFVVEQLLKKDVVLVVDAHHTGEDHPT